MYNRSHQLHDIGIGGILRSVIRGVYPVEKPIEKKSDFLSITQLNNAPSGGTNYEHVIDNENKTPLAEENQRKRKSNYSVEVLKNKIDSENKKKRKKGEPLISIFEEIFEDSSNSNE
jgi:hypothetical protein